MVYEPTARAWTDAPATFAQLWRQRYRWSYGIMQSLWKHRHAVVERGRSGHLGRVGLLLTGLFQIVLPLLAPMVDIYLVYGLVFLDPADHRGHLGRGAAAAADRRAWSRSGWSGEPLRGWCCCPLQQIVYRQLMYAVLIQSVASAVAGTRLRWQKIPRAGRFSAAPRDLPRRPRAEPRAVRPERPMISAARLLPVLLLALLTAALRHRRAPPAPPPARADAAPPRRRYRRHRRRAGRSTVYVTFYGGRTTTRPAAPTSPTPTAGTPRGRYRQLRRPDHPGQRPARAAARHLRLRRRGCRSTS